MELKFWCVRGHNKAQEVWGVTSLNIRGALAETGSPYLRKQRCTCGRELATLEKELT